MGDIKDEDQPVRIRKKRSRRRHPKRKAAFWFLIILLITFILGAFTMIIPSLIDTSLESMGMGTTDRPMDSYIMKYKKELQRLKQQKSTAFQAGNISIE